MTKPDEVALQLLATLQCQRSEDDVLLQDVVDAEEIDAFKGVPTLKRGSYRDVTPMLKARFTYASTWTNAAAAQRWLSLSEMESVWDNQSILEQMELRKKYWVKCLLNKVPIDHLSLFGVDEDEKEETYLIWGKQSEPRVVQYVGYDEREFQDLVAYLEFLTDRIAD